MKRVILPLLLACQLSTAGQDVIPDYETARDMYFWSRLYASGGISIFCGRPFHTGEKLTITQMYPRPWIAEAFGCVESRCDNLDFRFAVADLHNLWPALDGLTSQMGTYAFGEIADQPDRRQHTDICTDFEQTTHPAVIIEPRDEVKGDIARSILYMAFQYGLPLHGMGATLKRWHELDPPDASEQARNDHIERLQGNRNLLID